MKIKKIYDDSPLAGKVEVGYKLISINKKTIEDSLDCMYKLVASTQRLVFENTDGGKTKVTLDDVDDLGVEFEADKIKVCRNKCIFCFVHQQPKGMRRPLYIKDEDFRLSFTHGNFISFSNLTEKDFKRIVKQRLSPLYVSVHATDDRLRRHLFQNKKLEPILPQLKYLTKNGITVHTQVVVCPDENDGAHLEKTIDDLASLYPGVETLGVVPVGLTRYREKLPKLKSFDKAGGEEVLKLIDKKQKRYLSDLGSRFVFAADEFYIMTGRSFPRLSEYEEMEQFENGIGMMRYMLTDFNRRKRYLKPGAKKKIAIITGMSAGATIKKEIAPVLKHCGYIVDMFPVENKFWGKNVTVSGLLTGGDILRKLKSIENKYQLAILPPNCLNNDNLFLDDMPLGVLQKKVKIEIALGRYSMVDTFNEVAQ